MRKLRVNYGEKFYTYEQIKAIGDYFYMPGEEAEAEMVKKTGSHTIYYVNGGDIPEGALYKQQVNAGVAYALYKYTKDNEERIHAIRVGMSKRTQEAMNITAEKFAKFKE